MERERLAREVDWARFSLRGVSVDCDGGWELWTWDLRSWPVALEAHELLAAVVVVLELCI